MTTEEMLAEILARVTDINGKVDSIVPAAPVEVPDPQPTDE